MLALAVGRVLEPHRRRLLAAAGPVVAHVDPQPPRLGPPAPGIEHRHRRVVGVHLGRRPARSGRARPPAGRASSSPWPTQPAMRRAIDVHAVARVDAALPVQRQVVAVLGHQHVRQQRRPGQAALRSAGSAPPPGRCAAQRTHASLGRTWRMTLKCAGTYSSCSETSSPIWRSLPPQALQPQARRPLRLGAVHPRLARQVLGQLALHGAARLARRSRVRPHCAARGAPQALSGPSAVSSSCASCASSCSLERAELLAHAARQLQLELVDHQLAQRHLGVALGDARAAARRCHGR